LPRLLGLGTTGPIVGTAVFILSSAGLFYTERRYNDRFEGPMRDFLGLAEAAGHLDHIDPMVHEHLANTDSTGRGITTQIVDVSAYLGVAPGELLAWLGSQDESFVHAFVRRLHRLRYDENGVPEVGSTQYEEEDLDYYRSGAVHLPPDPSLSAREEFARREEWARDQLLMDQTRGTLEGVRRMVVLDGRDPQQLLPPAGQRQSGGPI
jgi:hypothetical protein